MPNPIPAPVLFALIVASVGFLIGLSKGGLSGLGTLVTPLFSLAMPNISQAVGTLLPMFIVGDIFAVYTYWGAWEIELVRQLLPGALVGIAIGTFVLNGLPVNTMRLALAGFTLIIVAYRLVSGSIRQLRYQPRPWHAPAAGTLSGLATSLFNAGGPPFSAYLLLQDVPPRPFVATTAIFFAILNLAKLPGFFFAQMINLPLLASFWWVFLFIPLGNWAGRWLVDRINSQIFEGLVVGLLVLSSGLLIWQSR